MLVARKNQINISEIGPPARGTGHSDVGFSCPFVLLSQVLGEVGVDHHRPGGDLTMNPL